MFDGIADYEVAERDCFFFVCFVLRTCLYFYLFLFNLFLFNDLR